MGKNVCIRGALLLGTVSALLSAPALAREPAMTVTTIIDYSLENNGELKALRSEKGLREAGIDRAGQPANPQIELEAATGTLTGSSDESSLSLGVSQEFILGGKRGKRLTVAGQEMEVYRWQLADRERALREAVKSAFYGVMLAEKRAELAVRAITLNRQLLEVAGERLAAGDIPELEMNLVRVELARSEASGIDAEQALLRSRADLWSLMGLPAGEEPLLSGSLEAGPEPVPPLEELMRQAGEQRPDLKVLEAEMKRSDAEVALAEAERLPTVTAGLFFTHDRRSDATGTGVEKVRDNLLALRFSVPIPLTGNVGTGVQEARSRLGSSTSRLMAAKRNLEREIATVYARYRNSEKILALYNNDILPQLEENLLLTREAWRLGEVGILSVIQEQKKFFEVHDGYLSALHDRQAALVKLEAVTAVNRTGGEK